MKRRLVTQAMYDVDDGGDDEDIDVDDGDDDDDIGRKSYITCE